MELFQLTELTPGAAGTVRLHKCGMGGSPHSVQAFPLSNCAKEQTKNDPLCKCTKEHCAIVKVVHLDEEFCCKYVNSQITEN